MTPGDFAFILTVRPDQENGVTKSKTAAKQVFHPTTGIVSLAAVFARTLAKSHPELRVRLEAEAEAEFRRLNAEGDLDAAAILAMLLRELHNLSLAGKT